MEAPVDNLAADLDRRYYYAHEQRDSGDSNKNASFTPSY